MSNLNLWLTVHHKDNPPRQLIVVFIEKVCPILNAFWATARLDWILYRQLRAKMLKNYTI